jgi:hypothetical protein
MRRPMATKILTREERIRNRWLVLLATIAIALFIAAGGDDPQAEVDLYCDMVQLHKDSKGEAGWPAYQGEVICEPGK